MNVEGHSCCSLLSPDVQIPDQVTLCVPAYQAGDFTKLPQKSLYSKFQQLANLFLINVVFK